MGTMKSKSWRTSELRYRLNVPVCYGPVLAWVAYVLYAVVTDGPTTDDINVAIKELFSSPPGLLKWLVVTALAWTPVMLDDLHIKRIRARTLKQERQAKVKEQRQYAAAAG